MKISSSKITKLIITMTMLVFFILLEEKTFAEELSIDLLISNNESVELLKKQLKSVDSEIEFSEIPEINLLRINNPDDDEKVKQVIDNNDEVILSGKIADKIVMENNIITNKELMQENELMSILGNSKTEENSETELLNKLSWYTNKLTQNKKSFEYSRGKNINIGLIDSGVDISHPLISHSLNLNDAKSFVDDDESITDLNGHGTMVAGIITQISPDAKITPYKVMSAEDGESFWTLQAIIQAVNDKQDIINMSLGTYKYENKEDERITIEAFKRATSYAFSKRVMIVASAGNQGLNSDDNYKDNHVLHLPGDIDGVITVTATNTNDQLALYSNTGSNTQYTAPGGEMIFDDNGYLDARELIYTTYPLYMFNPFKDAGIPDGYTITYGTSFSSACITAVFADYYAYYLQTMGEKPNSKRANEDISSQSFDLGDQGKDSLYGYGIPDLLNTYDLILNNQ